MRQHPIPQNVTQYQFRLVGNMTLKQFLELAGGIILAYLTYLSNLLIIIKLPLSLFFGLLGLGMAFFPIEERPLDQWILNFFKAIYSPTLYLWKKEPHLPEIFSYTFTPQPQQTPASRPQTNTTAQSFPQPQTPSGNSAEQNSKLFNQINQIFAQFDRLSQGPPPSTVNQTITRKPSIRIRKLNSAIPAQPTSSPQPPTQPKPIPSPKLKPTQTQLNPKPQPTLIKPAQPTPKIIFTPPAKTKPTPTTPQETIDIRPLTPTKPNLVAGLVTGPNQKLLPGLIVEIIDSHGTPQRAVKTNALGQFSISTPLPPGEYLVRVEADKYAIPAQKITINNRIIPPLHLHPHQQPATNN